MTTYHQATVADADTALRAADACFDEFRSLPPARRAELLEEIALGIEALGEELIETAHRETALPMARLQGERARTCNQARMFAKLILDGTWLDARIDHGDPERQPLPKPDVRLMMQPLGPVVVFGASNFPLAISVAGTDTVSALAAGCPVIVKAHSEHPQTCALVAGAIKAAVAKLGLPAGVFAMFHGSGRDIGMALVKHPLTCAVTFTGSLLGGRAIYDAACARPQPIPFYGEMSSINPVFLLPDALAERAEKIAATFLTSLTMGVGQFCTNPGVIIGVDGPDWRNFLTESSNLVKLWQPATMLHGGICDAYCAGVERFSQLPGVTVLATSAAAPGDAQAAAILFGVSAVDFLARHEFDEEVFGPASVAVTCRDTADLLAVVESLDGQLSASIHGTAGDLLKHARLVRILERKAGRIIFNGYATGIEVCHAMHHGGPYPATTHAYFTSIGSAAIRRFVRPVCYQDFPDDALPAAIQEGNPTRAWRLVDGKMADC